MPLPSPKEIAKLPPDGGPEFNRLVFEKSPYLLQHARNPVDWYPWGAAAFERALAEDKPVFLSIGYSTCHWCHVMEHESFEDEEVAKLLDASFVCVKVDREERPDVDQLYMSYTQARTGSGGWPMTVILTPDRRPFFAGTYFPKHGRYGRPGMMELVPAIATAWKEQRDAVLADADAAVKALGQMVGGTPGGALDERTLENAWRQLRQMHDAQHGGFGDRPKFPIPHNLRFLLRWHARSGSGEALEVVTRTLDAMRRGGIWDHVGHGFHRYSTDAEWLLPHFEKMLYDQALMALAYVEAWQVTGEARHRRTAEEIFAYVLGDMTAPEGGFYSAEDADSAGEEGLFYLWTTDELEGVLGAQDAELAALVWNADPKGNFTDEATGRRTARNILHLSEDRDAIAARLGLEPAALAARLESIRQRLFAARERRVHPLKDDKVLTDWNGLMIAALALAARAFDAPEYERAARRAADFALATLRDGTGRLYKRWRQGEAALPGVLDDYAFLAHGLLELHETTQELTYLQAALALVEQAVLHFEDEERGGFFLSADDGEELFVHTKDSYDGAIPSGNALMFSNLLRLARITADERYEELAQRTLRSFSGDVARSPANHCQLLLALDMALGPSFEIVIVGDPKAEDVRSMLRALHRPFRPNKVVLLRSEAEAAPLAALAPYTEEQKSLEGRATAYVCRDFACLAPTTEIAAMLRALEKP